MSKPKLRRSIYIGIGGTGTDAIKLVKDYFIDTTTRVPSMVKFLAIDTNQQELEKKGFSLEEQLPLVLSKPQSIYNDKPERYSWIPSKNTENIQSIGTTGAGQVRSNGSFVLHVKENGTEGSFSRILMDVRKNLLKIVNKDPDYDLLTTATIDVHLCFSICGGTGSGMFLEIAKIIKTIIPNSNLIGYALSSSFYENVGVHWNVKSNAYASLLELDYCMHAHKSIYQNSAYVKVNKKPFDALMYIDNLTYTRKGFEEEYTYSREEVLSNIAYAMVLTAGGLGDEANSIIDNLKAATISGGYDVECKNGRKSAWVSSLGVSEIFCKKNSGLDLFSHNLSIQVLNQLINGKAVGAADIAKRWIDEFNINEGGPEDEDDHDGLIDRMISPVLYQQISAYNSIKVDDAGNIDDSVFLSNAPVKFSTLESVQKTFAEDIIVKLNRNIENLLFPAQGSQTCGLTFLETVLSTFKERLEKYETRMDVEIKDLERKQQEIASEQETLNQKLINAVAKTWTLPATKQQAIATIKNSIKKCHLDNYKNDCEIERRKMALKVYGSMIHTIVEDYTDQIERLKTVINKVLKELNSEVGQFQIPEKIERKSTSIDVSFEISNLPSSQIDDAQISNWKEFYTNTGRTSLKTLADKEDWKEYTLKYVCKQYPKETNSPIVQILKSFDSKQLLNAYIKDVLNRARPLMDITTYGKEEDIHPTEFVIVSLPDSNETETQFIRDTFTAAYTGDNDIQFVPTKDSNRILVYRQLGVIPPYYIKGISKGKNGEYDPYSCEEAYKELRTGIDNYSPFSDIAFEQAVVKGGHTLDSFLGAISENDTFDMWVTGFILKLFSRNEDNYYRFKSSFGELDMDDPELNAYVILGKNRKDALAKFEKLSDEIKSEFAKTQTQILSNPDVRIEYDRFFTNSNVVLKEYKESHSLITNEEYTDDKYILQKEFEYLRKDRNRI